MKNIKEEPANLKNAILSLEGANCTSCGIAIEHLGRRIDGIWEIYVDRGTSTINIAYDGNRAVLERICEFVDQLGYRATIQKES